MATLHGQQLEVPRTLKSFVYSVFGFPVQTYYQLYHNFRK